MDIVGELYLAKAVNQLRRGRDGDRLVRLLYLRFWGNMTLGEIAEEFGVGPGRALQLERKALSLLKRKLGNTKISDYFSVTVNEAATI